MTATGRTSSGLAEVVVTVGEESGIRLVNAPPRNLEAFAFEELEAVPTRATPLASISLIQARRRSSRVLREFENRWRPPLARVSLIAELEFTNQELNTALFCAGHIWQFCSVEQAAGIMRASYPAAFAVAAAGTASAKFEGGNAWKPIL